MRVDERRAVDASADTRARNSRNSNATGKLPDGNPTTEFRSARCHRPVLTCRKEWPPTKVSLILLYLSLSGFNLLYPHRCYTMFLLYSHSSVVIYP